MLLRANKFRKDKESDCRRNELGSRIFMGRVFGDYAECLHFYPSFSYGRIIAGQSREAGSLGTLRGGCTKKCVGIEGISAGAEVDEATLRLQRKAACKPENLQAAF